ncbi:hypothetical protein, partial [Paraburkholderia sp.]|uniref:hypothetical protein n=1 Tax=Paraburkholderia sp. TaxID=1926495 RepID=UPI00397D75EF
MIGSRHDTINVLAKDFNFRDGSSHCIALLLFELSRFSQRLPLASQTATSLWFLYPRTNGKN